MFGQERRFFFLLLFFGSEERNEGKGRWETKLQRDGGKSWTFTKRLDEEIGGGGGKTERLKGIFNL